MRGTGDTPQTVTPGSLQCRIREAVEYLVIHGPMGTCVTPQCLRPRPAKSGSDTTAVARISVRGQTGTNGRLRWPVPLVYNNLRLDATVLLREAAPIRVRHAAQMIAGSSVGCNGSSNRTNDAAHRCRETSAVVQLLPMLYCCLVFSGNGNPRWQARTGLGKSSPQPKASGVTK